MNISYLLSSGLNCLSWCGPDSRRALKDLLGGAVVSVSGGTTRGLIIEVVAEVAKRERPSIVEQRSVLEARRQTVEPS